MPDFEARISFRKKFDRNGKPYWFASPTRSVVMFIYDEPSRGGVDRAVLVLRPYSEGARKGPQQAGGRGGDDDDGYEAPWRETG